MNLTEDDVMAGYQESRRRRHGGLSPSHKCKPEDFLSKGLKIDMNRFKSIWGLNVEDITTRVTRPRGVGLRHNDHHMKPSIKLEDGGSLMGLRPGGGLRLVVINRRYGMTCSVRQE